MNWSHLRHLQSDYWKTNIIYGVLTMPVVPECYLCLTWRKSLKPKALALSKTFWTMENGERCVRLGRDLQGFPARRRSRGGERRSLIRATHRAARTPVKTSMV